MSKNYSIKYESNPSSQQVELLSSGIIAYAKEKKDLKPLEPFGFFVQDESDQIIGGCNGVILYGCIHTDQLWLEESLRHKGYGTKLMQLVEKLGKENGCPFATVNTMDWEALGFYQKLGYTTEFERHGYLKESVFYFLRKKLT